MQQQPPCNLHDRPEQSGSLAAGLRGNGQVCRRLVFAVSPKPLKQRIRTTMENCGYCILPGLLHSLHLSLFFYSRSFYKPMSGLLMCQFLALSGPVGLAFVLPLNSPSPSSLSLSHDFLGATPDPGDAPTHVPGLCSAFLSRAHPQPSLPSRAALFCLWNKHVSPGNPAIAAEFQDATSYSHSYP